MSVKRRLKLPSAARLDVPMLRSIESGTTADFDDLIRGSIIARDDSFVVRGFDLINNPLGLPPEQISLKIADATLFHAKATEPGTILNIPFGTPDIILNPANTKVIGSFAANVINYVAIDYRRVTDPGSIDLVSVWSEEEKTEVKKLIPTAYVLEYRIIISTAGFGRYLPLYKVTTATSGSSVVVTSVENCKAYMYRLGRGGTIPNPNYSYPWPTDSSGNRNEGSLVQTSAWDASKWQRGDFSITNEKAAFDATWSRIKELAGSAFWYSDSSNPLGPTSISNLFFDSVGSVMTSGGRYAFTVMLTTQGISDTLFGNFSGEGNKLAGLTTVTAPWYTNLIGNINAETMDSGNSELAQGVLYYSDALSGTVNGHRTLLRSYTGGTAAGDKTVFRSKIPVTSIFVAGSQIISSYVSASGTIAVTTASPHVYVVGQLVDIINSTNGTVNIDGSHTVTAVTSTTYSFALSLTNGTYTPSGTSKTYSRRAVVTLPSWVQDGTGSIFNSTGSSFASTIAGASASELNLENTQTFYGSSLTQLLYILSANIDGGTFVGTITLDAVLYVATNLIDQTAGPVAWDLDANNANNDIYIRSIIGPRNLKIPYNGVSRRSDTEGGVQDGTAFNKGFGPGTMVLQNNLDVAFIQFERNKVLASGQNFSVGAGGVVGTSPAATWTSSPIPLQTAIQTSTLTVRVGDYVKPVTAPDTEWRTVVSMTGAVITTLNAGFSGGAYVGPLAVTRAVYGSNTSTLDPTDYIWIGNQGSVPASADVYWLAFRSDRFTGGSPDPSQPVVYLRSLELDLGEERQINDNVAKNLLNYVGARDEGDATPDYTDSSSEAAYTGFFDTSVTTVDPQSNLVTLFMAVPGGIQAGDSLRSLSNAKTYRVAFPVSSTQFYSSDDVSDLPLASARVLKNNYSVTDGDNLTVGIRKTSRDLGQVETVVSQPFYDESIYVQRLDLMNASGPAFVSGDFITWPGGLAWVIAAPGGEVKDGTGSTLGNSMLVHVYTGTITTSGINLTQGSSSAQSASALQETPLFGDATTGQVVKLPPSQRSGISSNLAVGPLNGQVRTHAFYNAKSGIGGGELLLVSNDTLRECGLDYLEVVGGPGTSPTARASIRIVRQMPNSTRLRFRKMPSFASSVSSGSGAGATLQNAYDSSISGGGSASIVLAAGKPILISATSASAVGITIGGVSQVTGAGSSFRGENDLQSTLGSAASRFLESWTGSVKIKGGSNYTGSELDLTQVNVTTTSAAFSPAYTFTLVSGIAYRVKATVLMRRTDTGDETAYMQTDALFSGTSGLVSVTSMVFGSTAGATAYACTADVSGGLGRILVAGNTGHTVVHTLALEIQQITGAA